MFPSGAADNWERFYEHIGTCDLYRDETLIDKLLHDAATLPIKAVGKLHFVLVCLQIRFVQNKWTEAHKSSLY